MAFSILQTTYAKEILTVQAVFSFLQSVLWVAVAVPLFALQSILKDSLSQWPNKNVQHFKCTIQYN